MPNVNNSQIPIPQPSPLRRAATPATATAAAQPATAATTTTHQNSVNVAGHKTRELQGNVSFPTKAAGGSSDINTRATFFDSNAATGKEIDAVLKHYGSPHAGKGETIARICREKGINPILMLAVMQKESSYGNKNNNPSLKDENIANPWSVHFSPSAKGINKLRMPDGSMPTFEQSLNSAIDTLKKWAGDSPNPLKTAAPHYCEDKPDANGETTWYKAVGADFRTQFNRIAKM